MTQTNLQWGADHGRKWLRNWPTKKSRMRIVKACMYLEHLWLLVICGAVKDQSAVYKPHMCVLFPLKYIRNALNLQKKEVSRQVNRQLNGVPTCRCALYGHVWSNTCWPFCSTQARIDGRATVLSILCSKLKQAPCSSWSWIWIQTPFSVQLLTLMLYICTTAPIIQPVPFITRL